MSSAYRWREGKLLCSISHPAHSFECELIKRYSLCVHKSSSNPLILITDEPRTDEFPLRLLPFDKAAMSSTNLSTNNTCLRPRIYYLWTNTFSWRFQILLFIIKPRTTSTTNFSLEDKPHERGWHEKLPIHFSLSMEHCLNQRRIFCCLLMWGTR